MTAPATSADILLHPPAPVPAPAPHTHPPGRYQSSSVRQSPLLTADSGAHHSLAASNFSTPAAAAAGAPSRAQPARYHRSGDSTTPKRAHDNQGPSSYEHDRLTTARSQHRSSTSRDRASERAPSSASVDPPSPRRRRSHRSSSYNSQPPHPSRPLSVDMASTVAQNPGPAPVPPPDPRSSSNPSKTRSRTTIPTQSGKWILGKTIGAGSMGKVKLAKKEEGGEQASNVL